MAMIERDVVLVGKDASGNTTVDLPITRLGNLEDTAEMKSVPVSGDALAIVDSEANGEVKKISWADVMNAVKDAVGGDNGAALEELKRTLDEHEANSEAHITADERATWDKAKETLDAHASDDVAHVTAQEREKWNSGSGDTAKVGDILYSYRRDLGDKWALCNGDLVDPKEYPELNALMPEGGKYGDAWISISGENAPGSARWIDGYWYGLHAVEDSGGWVLVYSKTLSGPWRETKLSSANVGTELDSYGKILARKGSCWVVYSTSANRIYYTQGSLVDGDWASGGTSNTYGNRSLVYHNGIWVGGYVTSSNKRIYYHAGETPDGTWTVINGLTKESFTECVAHDGIWAGYYTGYSYVRVTEDPTAGTSWKQVRVEVDGYNVSNIWVRGKYVWAMCYKKDSTYYSGCIARVTLRELWDTTDKVSSTSTEYIAAAEIVKKWEEADGYYNSINSSACPYPKNGWNGTWDPSDETHPAYITVSCKNGASEEYWRSGDGGDTWELSSEEAYQEDLNNAWTREGMLGNAATLTGYVELWRKLPKIPVPGGYAYIKVKE